MKGWGSRVGREGLAKGKEDRLHAYASSATLPQRCAAGNPHLYTCPAWALDHDAPRCIPNPSLFNP